MSVPEHSVGTRTLRGMAWAYGSYVGGRLLVLVATAILARLLTPADFGLVALALVFIAFLETVSDVGLTQALMIVKEDELEQKADTVWVVSVLLGAVMWLIVAALGPLAASFFDQSELTALMPVLGANIFLRMLGMTHYALAQKRLDFRSRTVAEFADVLVRGTAGIGLAIAGAGAWSLVLGYLVGTVAMTATLWVLVPWRPSFRARRSDLSGLIGFGGALTGVNVIGAVMANADDVIVGRVLGTTALGLYSLAYRLPELLILNFSNVAAKVLFPAMTAIERAAVPGAFLTSLRYGLMVGLPLTVGLGVMAEPLTLALFGDQWRDAAPAMQVMALWTLMAPIGVIIGTAYKALARADILLKLAVPQAVLLIASVLIVAGEGIVAVAACQAAIAIAFTILAMVIATHMLNVTARELWTASWPALAAAAGLGAALVPVDRAVSSPWPALAAGLAVGTAVYGGLLWLLARDTLRQLIAMAFPGRQRPTDAHPTPT
jgi:lipopolysaccharide exporter